MIQVVIPAAGNGQRFKDAGYENPKYLIDVCGKPMIDRVIQNLTPRVENTVQVITPDRLQRPSRGAVETIIQAELDLEQPLLIGNCDQLVAFNVNDFIDIDLDGRIVTFQSTKPHHSYVTVDNEVITSIVEKPEVPPTNYAVTGVYYFAKARDFYDYAIHVISDNEKVNGEFYVSSVLAKLIEDGFRIGTYDAPSAMLGTPDELQLFENAVAVAKGIL